MKDIFMLIGAILFVLIVLELLSKLIDGKWFWQIWKERKEREAKFAKYVDDLKNEQPQK